MSDLLLCAAEVGTVASPQVCIAVALMAAALGSLRNFAFGTTAAAPAPVAIARQRGSR